MQVLHAYPLQRVLKVVALAAGGGHRGGRGGGGVEGLSMRDQLCRADVLGMAVANALLWAAAAIMPLLLWGAGVFYRWQDRCRAEEEARGE
jgi:hypothetical protein